MSQSPAIVARMLRPGFSRRLEDRFFAAEVMIDANTLSLAVSVLDAARWDATRTREDDSRDDRSIVPPSGRLSGSQGRSA